MREREREREICSFNLLISFPAGDMEFKQNKFLPAEKQVVTANPDINTVSVFSVSYVTRSILLKFSFFL